MADPIVQGRKVAWGNLEYRLLGSDVNFQQTVADFKSFSASSGDNSELVPLAGGAHSSTEGDNVPGDSTMTWYRTQFLRFITAVCPEDGSKRLSEFTFSLTIVEMLRQTRETHREGWVFRFHEASSGAEAGGASALEMELPLLLLDHTFNGRRM